MHRCCATHEASSREVRGSEQSMWWAHAAALRTVVPTQAGRQTAMLRVGHSCADTVATFRELTALVCAGQGSAAARGGAAESRARCAAIAIYCRPTVDTVMGTHATGTQDRHTHTRQRYTVWDTAALQLLCSVRRSLSLRFDFDSKADLCTPSATALPCLPVRYTTAH
jgi:hypothetical protein